MSTNKVNFSITRPQVWEISDMSLHRLLTAGRSIEKSSCTQFLKIAVISDAATQHYCEALGATLKLRGWWPEIYEAEFDTIHQETLNTSSGLYLHQPKFVIVFQSVQALAQRFYAVKNKKEFAEGHVTDLLELWDRISSNLACTLLHHNFAVPLDRPYGNQSLAYPTSFIGTVTGINAKLNDLVTKKNIRLIDTEFQASYFGKRNWFDERLWCQARQALSPTFLAPLVKSISDTLLADRGLTTKCVILDLDNTMWGGILGDDGIDHIEIGPTEIGLAYQRFQQYLTELRDRGVLLAICSKNEQEAVLKVLDTHPDMILRRNDFVAIFANYDDKASNIIAIQKKLNLAFDSFVFLDDSPFERDLVRKAFPEIQVPELPEDPGKFQTELSRWNFFECNSSASEDFHRLKYYKDDEERAAVRAKYIGLDDFLFDLEMSAVLRLFNQFTSPRVLQLIHRTNQFNLTTIRYSKSELESIIEDANTYGFCLSLSDRLGDNGIIAVIILRKESIDLKVDTWIMSCRVLGRRVEELILNIIVDKAKELGCFRIIGQYIQTNKNALVKDLYSNLGFVDAGSVEKTKLYSFQVETFEAKKIPIVLEPNHISQEES